MSSTFLSHLLDRNVDKNEENEWKNEEWDKNQEGVWLRLLATILLIWNRFIMASEKYDHQVIVEPYYWGVYIDFLVIDCYLGINCVF